MSTRPFQFERPSETAEANQIYESLGRFVVSFERVCSALRQGIFVVFRRNGTKDQNLVQIMINNMAASELKTTLDGLYRELQNQDEDDRRVVKNIFKKVQDLLETRNLLLHSEWHFRNLAITDESSAFAKIIKWKATPGSGAHAIVQEISVTVLEEKTKEAVELQIKLNRLCICLNQTGFKVSSFVEKPL